MEEKRYFYRADVVSVYDGDTCKVNLDLGFGVWKMTETLRLHRINAPEMRGAELEAGRASRDYLRGLILDKRIVVQTLRDDQGKYGRYLAEIWLFDALNQQWRNVNDMLVAQGHAVLKDY
ncbi:MAG TPA: thermonuclease family protein [Malonomonas sp.]